MALPIGTMGIRSIPGEEKVVASIKDAIREPGFYFIPGRDMNKPMSESEAEAYVTKLRQGPSGVMVIHPEGSESMSPRQLSTELGSSIVAAFSSRPGADPGPVGLFRTSTHRDCDGPFRIRQHPRLLLELVRLPHRLHHRGGP